MSPEPKEYRQHRFSRPPGACELLLVRHGESQPIREGEEFPLVDGSSDPPLDPVGHAQAERVAERLAAEPIERIYVSSLTRTHQTAAPLVKRLGIEPIVEPDLREVNMGEWEAGLFRQKVTERDPIAIKMFVEERYDVIPGAEPQAEFEERVRGVMNRIAADNKDRTVAVFCHGGVIGMTFALAARSRGFAFAGSDNGSISHIVVTGERWSIRRYNDTAHLNLQFTTEPEPLI
jgi:probable phosphoglycerate mutase